MTSPKIRISNSDSGFSGHWWADIDDGDGNVTRASFGPKEITGVRGLLGALGFPVDTADGEFRSGKPGPYSPTFKRPGDSNMDRPRNQVTIPIDREGYERAMDRINAWEAAAQKPGGIDYRAAGVQPNNCIDPTQDIATAAGVPGQIADYFPTDALRGSLAGRQAMHRAGVRADDPGAVPDFPDMAFPWGPTPSDRAPVSVPTEPEPTPNNPGNLFNSAAPRAGDGARTLNIIYPEWGGARNWFNSDSLPENLLNMSPEEMRWAKYRY